MRKTSRTGPSSTMRPAYITATRSATSTATRADWPRLHQLQKPFDVHELRHALATILAAG